MLDIFLFIAKILNSIFLYKIFDLPLLILLIIIGTLYLSIKCGFPNIRYFKHGIDIAVHNKYYSPSDPGEITPRQALFTSISGSIGLGSIAGVAIAISVGGPGTIIWMIITAFFSMNTVFAETILSQTYKKVEKDGKTNGGPFRYLRYGLEDIGYKKIGIILSEIFSFLLVFGSFGSGMFQINQAITTITDYEIFKNFKIILGIITGLFVLYALFNGVKLISKIVAKLVPMMAILYTLCSIVIIAYNYENIIPSILSMFESAIGYRQVAGGFLGGMIVGIQRSIFSTEAGLGTSSIAHAVAKTKEPVRQASISCLTPMITMFFCLLTALIILTTNAQYTNTAGVTMTKEAFLTVSNWFPILLSICIVLFAFSNVLSYSFYGQSAWRSFFKNKWTIAFNVAYALAIIISSVADLESIIIIADTFVLSMAVPNFIGLFLLSNLIKRKVDHYDKNLQNKTFDQNIFQRIFTKIKNKIKK